MLNFLSPRRSIASFFVLSDRNSHQLMLSKHLFTNSLIKKVNSSQKSKNYRRRKCVKKTEIKKRCFDSSVTIRNIQWLAHYALYIVIYCIYCILYILFIIKWTNYQAFKTPVNYTYFRSKSNIARMKEKKKI